jgi:hypothetical protein
VYLFLLRKQKVHVMYDVIKYLGIFLDSIKMEARLPRDKIVRIQQIIESFSMHNSCTKKELLSLLGQLNFAYITW